jgi:hypothetical protein
MKPYPRLIPIVGLLPGACASSPPGGRGAPKIPRTPSPEQLVEQLQAELIPAVDTLTGYGPHFNQDGYDMLLRWNRDIRPEESWAADYEALNITLPCCAAAHPNRDETLNCACGHHQALYGVAKWLLQRGYTVTEVQTEVDQWKAFFFPRERLMAELVRRF